jgi:hypothetical protein
LASSAREERSSIPGLGLERRDRVFGDDRALELGGRRLWLRWNGLRRGRSDSLVGRLLDRRDQIFRQLGNRQRFVALGVAHHRVCERILELLALRARFLASSASRPSRLRARGDLAHAQLCLGCDGTAFSTF